MDPTNLQLTQPIDIQAMIRRQLPPGRRWREFIKGPLPLNWFAKAAALPGKALAVGLCLWFQAGCSKTMTVKLSRVLLDKLHVERHAGRRGLIALEGAGLVRATRRPGRAPVVEILEAPQGGRQTSGMQEES